MKKIIINATAARTSGAFTILSDFMSFIYNETEECDYHFYLLTTTHGLFYSNHNITVYELPVQNWYARLCWDHSGFQKWCDKNTGVPDLVISFQNTCPRLTDVYRDVQLLVYYHQPLPLIKYKWQLFRSNEQKLYLYAHFYGYFVNRWNNNAQYVVQLSSVKELFCKKFPNIKPERVHVIRPNLPQINVDSIFVKQTDEGKKVFIYPATPLRYKNHEVIMQALNILNSKFPDSKEKLKIIFTVSEGSFVAKRVWDMNVATEISCIGSISYEELLSYYAQCDALLFPSKIESFGLPLIEAAMFGIPIIAADLPYANEVLEDYDNKVFFNPDDANALAAQMELVLTGEKTKRVPMKQTNHNTWNEFINIIHEMLSDIHKKL